MNQAHNIRVIHFGLALLICFVAMTATAQSLPRVFSLDPAKLAQTKARIAKQDMFLQPALTRLRKDADKAMLEGPFTVTAKQRVPPSGDKHDYLTLAPYWWPDPAKPDGLPYIRRDGEVNPESKRETDNATLNAMANAVETLSLAYYFTGEAKYADRAAVLLRAWFIDKATKMNPHYEYAQAVMGQNNGRGAGLIDARKFIQVVDAVGLLAGAKTWTKQDQQGVQDWFRAFVKWMQTSANGKDEAKARNNHGSWYAAQLAAFALFIGDEALARQTVEAVKARIAWQVEPDGRQPLELERTRGMSYSLFNLRALCTVAAIGDKLQLDLWNYQTSDGRSMQQALAYLAPVAFGEKQWPHQQIIQWSPEDYFTPLRQAAGKIQDERFRALWAKVPTINPAERFVLLYGNQPSTADFTTEIRQITFGPKHTFFGYIGHVRTIPWNQSGRYALALRTDFQERMPKPGEAAEVVLLDAKNNYAPRVVDHTRAWNFQQGTMFYWNPAAPETQFFFNDRDPNTNDVFCVLFDITKNKRIAEYRFADGALGNGGVAQNGGWFLAINYGRLARLRPVTGYPGVGDWSAREARPANDGVFKVNVKTKQKQLLVSFKQLADVLRPTRPDVDQKALFINHTLWSRDDGRIFFFVRGDFEDRSKRLDVPFTMKADGSDLRPLAMHIGGHPEWLSSTRMIGAVNKEQIIFDVEQQKIVGKIGSPEIIPDPGGDIALSPNGQWFVNGFGKGGRNYYNIIRLSDSAWTRTEGVNQGGYITGELRIDPSPDWNRNSTQFLVGGVADDAAKTRQLFLITIRQQQ